MSKEERDAYVQQALHSIELHDAEHRADRFAYLSDPDAIIMRRGEISGLVVA